MKNLNKLNTTNSEENANITEPCLVCGSPTSTLHYQIIICYACAAFYRRSIKTHLSYVCQRNDRKCNVVNRSISWKANVPILPISKMFNGWNKRSKTEKDNKKVKEEIITAEQQPDNLPEHEKPISESFDKIFETAFKILEGQRHFSIISTKLNYIEDFSKILLNFMEETKPKQSLILIVNDNIRLNFLKDFYLNSAKMLLNFSPFASLPLQEKIILHQEFWENFHCLERSHQACKYYGYDQNDFRMPLDNYQYYDSSKSDRHFRHFANHKPFILFFHPLIEKAMFLQRLIKKLKITDFEFTYISLLLLWNRFELPELHNSTLELGEKIISQASEELHDFYLEEFRMHSYAARQAQLFKLAHVVQLFVREKRKMITAKSLFDFEKENFPYCSFELNYYNFINKRSL